MSDEAFEAAKWAPLIPPSEQDRKVFECALEENPEMDMRASPHGWVIHERDIGRQFADRAQDAEKREERLREEMTRNIQRLRATLQRIEREPTDWALDVDEMAERLKGIARRALEGE